MKKAIKLMMSTIAIAIIMGIISAIFLNSLEFVTNLRNKNQYLILLIPIIGTLTIYIYNEYGNGSEKGNNLVIESVHKNVEVPFRMSVLTFVFTILTHFCGGSAGREGTAVQISGALTNKLSKILKFTYKEKRILIMSGISAAFGSVFGTPLAGTFFGMEMCFVGKLSYESMFNCFVGSYLANFITNKVGVTHGHYIIKLVPEASVYTLIIIIISSIVFGLFGKLFSIGIHFLKNLYKKIIKNYILRAVVSSVIVLLAIILFNMYKYEGLSLELIKNGFNGEISLFDSINKLILTILTLSAGFQGGEVTPLFDIGASLGGAISNLANMEPSLLAALGMICVFGSAANTPITTIMLGIDLFSSEGVAYYIISSIISYYVIGHNGIYRAQVIKTPKKENLKKHKDKSIGNLK